MGRAQLGEWTGRNARARAQLDGSRAAILTYHRVLPTAEAEAQGVEPGMFVSPETFGRHAEWLAREFTVLPLGDIVTALAQGEALPDGACAVTFDDGWRDNYIHAWPILKRTGVPATIFLVASRVGTNGAFWTDEIWPAIRDLSPSRCSALLGNEVESSQDMLEKVKKLKPAERLTLLAQIRSALSMPAPDKSRELMDWDEVAEMAKGGIHFECHGDSHDLLTTLTDEAISAELAQALKILGERSLGQERILAYPNGSWDDRVAALAEAAGFRAAVTTERGLACSSDSLHALPRISIHDDVSRTRACFRRLIPFEPRRAEG